MKNASKHDPLRAKSRLVGYTVLAFVLGLGFASSMGWTQSSLAMPVIDESPQVSEAAVAPAKSLSEAFVNISDVVTPAVVRVSVKRPIRARGDMSRIPEGFRQFFDRQ